MTDFAADNYYARHDGTEDYTGQEGDDLTPMVVALDRTEAAVTTQAPLTDTDTDAAMTRIQGIARLAGIVVHVTEYWATCTCTTATHPWMKRLGAADEARAREWVAAAVSQPGRHVVHNRRLDGYTAWTVAE